MTVTAHASGTQAAAVGTEHFLTSPNVPGTFTLHVDTAALASGDTLELRIYQIVLTGGTARQVYFQSFTGPTQDGVQISVPVSNELTDTNALRFSLKQVAGTGRSFPWKVLKY